MLMLQYWSDDQIGADIVSHSWSHLAADRSAFSGTERFSISAETAACADEQHRKSAN